jgi:hypothetical protein
MGRTLGRVEISQNVEEMLNLASTVYEKHESDGDASPLLKLDGTSWKEIGPKIKPTLAKHHEAEELRKQADKAYRERDLYVSEIKETVQASKNLLKALNQKNPKRLADWGFDVHDSVQTPKPAKAK